MHARIWVAAAALALGAGIAQHRAPQALAADPQATGGQDTSTLDDQSELALTIYNSDLALVREGYVAATVLSGVSSTPAPALAEALESSLHLARERGAA